MDKNEKLGLLKTRFIKLNEFKLNLNDNNLNNFQKLKTEILNILSDKQKIRFNQIEFYEEVTEYNNISEEDLPF